MKFVLLLLMRVYRYVISPVRVACFGPACRYEPSCSAYMIEAITTHGAMRGSILGAKRLCRCHPWGGSGYDPVPPKSSASGLTCE